MLGSIVYPKTKDEIETLPGSTRLGLADEELQPHFVDDIRTLVERKLTAGEKAIRYVPIIQNSDSEPLLLYPESNTAVLDSLSSYLTFLEAREGAIFLAPHHWQLEGRFHKTCRNLGLSASSFYSTNLPVAFALIQQAELELLYIDKSTAIERSDEFQKHLPNMPSLRGVVSVSLVHEQSEKNITDFHHLIPYREIHLIPGYPVLMQTLAQTSSNEGCFTPSGHYLWELYEDQLYLTANSESSLPVYRFPLPPYYRFEEKAGVDNGIIKIDL